MGMSQLNAIFLLLAVTCVLPIFIEGLPTEKKSTEFDSSLSNDEDRRATWLETRNSKEHFKELIYLTMQELASEGFLNPDVLQNKSQEKRGRHQGFCFRKTKSGRFLPYICWKEADQEKK
jgi:hypothetical protein